MRHVLDLLDFSSLRIDGRHERLRDLFCVFDQVFHCALSGVVEREPEMDARRKLHIDEEPAKLLHLLREDINVIVLGAARDDGELRVAHELESRDLAGLDGPAELLRGDAGALRQLTVALGAELEESGPCERCGVAALGAVGAH